MPRGQGLADEYLDIVAFLSRANGIDLMREELTPESAATIEIRR